jgi:hypothetical protein
LWAVAGSLLLAGCQAPVEVETRANPSEFPGSWETYSIGVLPEYLPGVEMDELAAVQRAIMDALTVVLEEHGYRLDRSPEADLVVHVAYTSLPEVDISNTGYSGSRDRNWDLQYPVFELSLTVNAYEEGTLIIDIRRKHDGEWIWTGWVSQFQEGLAFDEGQIELLIREVLSRFVG